MPSLERVERIYPHLIRSQRILFVIDFLVYGVSIIENQNLSVQFRMNIILNNLNKR